MLVSADAATEYQLEGQGLETLFNYVNHTRVVMAVVGRGRRSSFISTST